MAVPSVTNLGKKMIERADRDKLPADHPMRVRALEFNDAADKYLAQPQLMAVAAFMGFWMRARRTWCNYTGDALI